MAELTGTARPVSAPALRVLVVEDNAIVALSLCELLQAWGYDASVAYDGAEALELARTFRPQVAFVDIGLPVLDGYQVARRLRAEEGEDPTLLVALTGYGEEDERRREGLFDLYLVKPVDPGALRNLLDELVEQRGAQ